MKENLAIIPDSSLNNENNRRANQTAIMPAYYTDVHVKKKSGLNDRQSPKIHSYHAFEWINNHFYETINCSHHHNLFKIAATCIHCTMHTAYAHILLFYEHNIITGIVQPN